MNNTEKRMIGEWEVVESIHFGGKEFVIGADTKNEKAPYMYTTVTSNELFELYNDTVVSDSYAEIVSTFAERIKAAADEKIAESEKLSVADKKIVPEKDIKPLSYEDDITGKIMVIKSEILCFEAQNITKQLVIAKCGFGCAPNSRGQAVFAARLYDGAESRWNRLDFAGEYVGELPEWVKTAAAENEMQISDSNENFEDMEP